MVNSNKDKLRNNAIDSLLRSLSPRAKQERILKASFLETRVGRLLAIADENSLFLLEFADRNNLVKGIERLRQKTNSTVIPGTAKPIDLIENELKQYFEGNLTKFKTPIKLLGTPFQVQVWKELRKIPLGQTRSYLDIAHAIGNLKAYRAVALANGANRLAIIVPCHRVIQADGGLGGYSGGIAHKQDLLVHENRA